MKNIAVFASGSGTNCENLIRHFQKSDFARVSMVVTNNPFAGVIEKTGLLDVDCYINLFQSDEDFNTLETVLAQNNISWIVLAGFLKLIPKRLLEKYPNRIVNIHPALLPDFGGKGMYGMNVHKAVIDAQRNISGITIHFVNEHYDKGAVIAQHSCPVYIDDSPETLAQRVHALEYAHYPTELEKLITVNITH